MLQDGYTKRPFISMYTCFAKKNSTLNLLTMTMILCINKVSFDQIELKVSFKVDWNTIRTPDSSAWLPAAKEHLR